MDWLVPLVIVLGLAAIAGIVWLHVETRAPRNPANPNFVAGFGPPGVDNEPAELAVTLRYLRRRAVYFRDLADRVADPVSGARYWDIAGSLDKAANALEANQPTAAAAPPGSPDKPA